MLDGNRIQERVPVEKFLALLKNYREDDLQCTTHTFFRLSEKQRRLFTCQTIRDRVFHETPVFVGIQNNGCYAAFYKAGNNLFMRIVLDIKPTGMDAVTFYVAERPFPVIK